MCVRTITTLTLNVVFTCQYHLYQLRQLQPQPNGQSLRVINNRTYQPVIVGQQIVVEPLRIGIRLVNFDPCTKEREKELIASLLLAQKITLVDKQSTNRVLIITWQTERHQSHTRGESKFHPRGK